MSLNYPEPMSKQDHNPTEIARCGLGTHTNSPMSLMHEEPYSRMGSEALSSVENKFYDLDHLDPCHLTINQSESFVGSVDHALAITTRASCPAEEFHRRGLSPSIKKEEPTRRASLQNLRSATQEEACQGGLDAEEDNSNRRERTPELPRYFCPFCGKPVARTYNYNTHLQTHDPYRQRPFQCTKPNCQKSFYRPTDLKRHDQSVS
ncbi:MAG: hypothetical protein Q9162_005795 [Coniocarpon cinnabarinum]